MKAGWQDAPLALREFAVIHLPCLSAPDNSTPKISPVRMGPLKLLPNNSVLNFLSASCIFNNLANLEGNFKSLIFSDEFLNFDTKSEIVLRQSLIAGKVSSRLEESDVFSGMPRLIYWL